MQKSPHIQISSTMPELLPMRGRSPGPHVSDMIDEICIERRIYKRRKGKAAQEMFEVGLSFEHAVITRYVRTWPERYIQPGEFQHNGICFTPDMLDITGTNNPRYPHAIDVDHEVKATWMKMEDSLEHEKYWRYHCQGMAYCYGLSNVFARPFNYCVLHVLFLRGDYVGKLVGYLEHLFHWTDEELAANWDLICLKGKEMEREGYWLDKERNKAPVYVIIPEGVDEIDEYTGGPYCHLVNVLQHIGATGDCIYEYHSQTKVHEWYENKWLAVGDDPRFLSMFNEE